MGVRCRDCGRESRLEPTVSGAPLHSPHPAFVQLQKLSALPTDTNNNSTQLGPFNLVYSTSRQRGRGEVGCEDTERVRARGEREKWNILAPDFNWQRQCPLAAPLHRWHRIHFPGDSLYVSRLSLSFLFLRQATVSAAASPIRQIAERQQLVFLSGHCVSWLYLCQHTSRFPVAFIFSRINCSIWCRGKHNS